MDDKNSIDELLDIVIKELDELHATFADGAKLLGYARDSLTEFKPFWVGLDGASRENTSLVPVVSGGMDILVSLSEELIGVKERLGNSFASLYSASGTVDSFLASSAATSSAVSVSGLSQLDYKPNPFALKNKESTADRFAKLDPSLGATYRQLEETLYATRSDNERAALLVIRQIFDHLFDILAPDKKVRTSKYWTSKEGDRPDQIYRIERIKYAAFTHIADPLRAKSLAATSKQMNELYALLNEAHTRGELNVDKARKALRAMKSMLDEWADALGL
jgi:hypothetical protein